MARGGGGAGSGAVPEPGGVWDYYMGGREWAKAGGVTHYRADRMKSGRMLGAPTVGPTNLQTGLHPIEPFFGRTKEMLGNISTELQRETRAQPVREVEEEEELNLLRGMQQGHAAQPMGQEAHPMGPATQKGDTYFQSPLSDNPLLDNDDLPGANDLLRTAQAPPGPKSRGQAFQVWAGRKVLAGVKTAQAKQQSRRLRQTATTSLFDDDLPR